MDSDQHIPHLLRGESSEAAIVGQVYLMQRLAQLEAQQHSGNGTKNEKWLDYSVKIIGVIIAVTIAFMSWLAIDHLRVSNEQARRTETVKRVESIEIYLQDRRDVRDQERQKIREDFNGIDRRLSILELIINRRGDIEEK